MLNRSHASGIMHARASIKVLCIRIYADGYVTLHLSFNVVYSKYNILFPPLIYTLAIVQTHVFYVTV